MMGLFVPIFLALQKLAPLVLDLPVAVGLDLLAHLSGNILATKISQGANVIVVGGEPLRDPLFNHPVIALPETRLIGVLGRLSLGIRQGHTRRQLSIAQHIHNVIRKP